MASLFGLRLSGNALGTQIKPEQTLSRGYRFVLMADFQELNIHLTTTGDFKRTGNTSQLWFQTKHLPKSPPSATRWSWNKLRTRRIRPAIQSAQVLFWDYYWMEMFCVFLVPLYLPWRASVIILQPHQTVITVSHHAKKHQQDQRWDFFNQTEKIKNSLKSPCPYPPIQLSVTQRVRKKIRCFQKPWERMKY